MAVIQERLGDYTGALAHTRAALQMCFLLDDEISVEGLLLRRVYPLVSRLRLYSMWFQTRHNYATICTGPQKEPNIPNLDRVLRVV